jgi:hypothetical protein
MTSQQGVTDSTEGTQTYKSMSSLIQDDLFFSISDFAGIFLEISLDFCWSIALRFLVRDIRTPIGTTGRSTGSKK